MVTTRQQQVNTLIARGQYCSAYNVALHHGHEDTCAQIKQLCREKGAVKFHHCDQTRRLRTIEFAK